MSQGDISGLAVDFVEEIKRKFLHNNLYTKFLEIMTKYKDAQIDSIAVVEQVVGVFQNYPDIIQKFSRYVPEEMGIQVFWAENMYTVLQLNPVCRVLQTGPIAEENSSEVMSTCGQPDRSLAVDNSCHPQEVSHRSQLYEMNKVTFLLGLRNSDVVEQVRKYLKCPNSFHKFLQAILQTNEGRITRDQCMRQIYHLLRHNPSLFRRLRNELPSKYSLPILKPESTTTPWQEKRLRDKRTIPDYYPYKRLHSYVKTSHFFDEEYSSMFTHEDSVLNNTYKLSPQAVLLKFTSSTHNPFEDKLYLIEDERYEMDMLLETNKSTMHFLKIQNEKLRSLCKSNDARVNTLQLKEFHKSAIKRIYGQSADLMLEGLMADPETVIPIIMKRLKSKELEWTPPIRALIKSLNKQQEKAYLRSLDFQGPSLKIIDRQKMSSKYLLKHVSREEVTLPCKITPDIGRDVQDLLMHNLYVQISPIVNIDLVSKVFTKLLTPLSDSCNANMMTSFIVSKHWYLVIRNYLVLCERLGYLKELSINKQRDVSCATVRDKDIGPGVSSNTSMRDDILPGSSISAVVTHVSHVNTMAEFSANLGGDKVPGIMTKDHNFTEVRDTAIVKNQDLVPGISGTATTRNYKVAPTEEEITRDMVPTPSGTTTTRSDEVTPVEEVTIVRDIVPTLSGTSTTKNDVTPMEEEVTIVRDTVRTMYDTTTTNVTPMEEEEITILRETVPILYGTSTTENYVTQTEEEITIVKDTISRQSGITTRRNSVIPIEEDITIVRDDYTVPGVPCIAIIPDENMMPTLSGTTTTKNNVTPSEQGKTIMKDDFTGPEVLCTTIIKYVDMVSSLSGIITPIEDITIVRDDYTVPAIITDENMMPTLSGITTTRNDATPSEQDITNVRDNHTVPRALGTDIISYENMIPTLSDTTTTKNNVSPSEQDNTIMRHSDTNPRVTGYSIMRPDIAFRVPSNMLVGNEDEIVPGYALTRNHEVALNLPDTEDDVVPGVCGTTIMRDFYKINPNMSGITLIKYGNVTPFSGDVTTSASDNAYVGYTGPSILTKASVKNYDVTPCTTILKKDVSPVSGTAKEKEDDTISTLFDTTMVFPPTCTDPEYNYDKLLQAVKMLLADEMEPGEFEEKLFFLYGIKGYPAVTLEKLIKTCCFQIKNGTNNQASMRCLDNILQKEPPEQLRLDMCFEVLVGCGQISFKALKPQHRKGASYPKTRK